MIWFVGAGPGDPELLTVRARKLLEEADVVVYAGSLIPREILACTSPEARVYDSSGMNLQEIVSVMVEAHRQGCKVVRLHTGDPSLYSAVAEQAALLEEQGVPYQVVPGVSSFSAAAAAVGVELTLPGVSQTVIITRASGRTPVPPKESLAELAKHTATMVLFLSAGCIDQVVQELLTAYPGKTPVAVVYKASQPEQEVIRGSLFDIADRVREAGITRTALIFVGNVLDKKGERSLLYDPAFSHSFRPARSPGAPTSTVADQLSGEGHGAF